MNEPSSERDHSHDIPNLDAIKYLIAQPKPEELEIAEAVIQDILKTPEEMISESSDLDYISGHSAYEIKTALGTKARQIMSMPGSRFGTKSLSNVEVFKQTEHGVVRLTLGCELDPRGEPVPGLRELNLELKSGNPLRHELDVHVSLREISRHYLSYGDRKGAFNSQSLEEKYEFPEEVQGSKLSIIRQLWRGLRCLSANIATWESPNFVMPEDLPQQSFERSLPKPT